MAIILPGAMQQLAGVSVTAQFERLRSSHLTRAFPSSATNGASRLDGQGGVWPQPNALNVTASGTPDMNVHVDRGSGLTPGTENIAQGNYPFFNDASFTVGIASSNTSQRIDSVVVDNPDTSFSGVTNTTQFKSFAGTPGSGSPPNLSVLDKNYLEVARVTVRANTGSILQTDIQMVAHNLPVGIDIPYSFELSNGGSFIGHPRVNQSTWGVEFWNGTNWTSASRVVGGDICNGVTGIAATEVQLCLTTLTLEPQSQYRITGYARIAGGAGDVHQVRLHSVNLAGSILDANETGLSPQAHGFASVYAFLTTTTAVSATWVLGDIRLSGTTAGTASTASHILVEKLGPAGILT